MAVEKIVMGAAGGSSGWILNFSSAKETTTGYGKCITMDSTGNIYVVGSTQDNPANASRGFVIKVNGLGDVQWQKYYAISSSYQGYHAAIYGPTTDVIYLVGNIYIPPGSAGDFDFQGLYGAITTSGSISTYHSIIGYSSGTDYWDVFTDGALSSNESYCYAAGSLGQAGQWHYAVYRALTVSGSTAYTYAFNTKAAGMSGISSGYGGVATISNNAYMFWNYYDSSYNQYAFMARGTSSSIIGQNLYSSIKPLRVTSDGTYIYMQGLDVNNKTCVFKLNTSGGIEWKKSDSSLTGEVGSIAVDSSGNVYYGGRNASTGTMAIRKLDSSGSLSWAREIGNPSDATIDYYTAYGIALKNDRVYVTGTSHKSSSGINNLIIVNLAADGSGVGTYGSWVYNSSWPTISVTSSSDVGAGFGSVGINTGNYTDYNSFGTSTIPSPTKGSF